jgi:hypothetical protein
MTSGIRPRVAPAWRRAVGVLALAAGMTFAGAAAAQGPEPAAIPAAADRIQVDVAPYLWMLSMNGSTQVGPIASHIDASFIDTLRNTDLLLGFMGHAEIGRGDWRVILDGVYTHAVVKNIAIGPASARFQADGGIFEIGGALVLGRFAMFNAISSRRDPVTIEALAGARVSVISQQFTLSAGPGASLSQTWADPFVGGRISVGLGERWTMRLRGDIGGFGLGSDFTWQTVGLIGYRFSLLGRPAEAVIGYRALGQDYRSGSGPRRFEWNMVQHGPVLGISTRF